MNIMQPKTRPIVAAWLLAGLTLLGGSILLNVTGPGFGYDVKVIDMPVVSLTIGLVSAGAIFLLLPWLIASTVENGKNVGSVLLWTMLATGLLARLILLGSEPILEDDYQRYLWDGAVTAHGMNPYKLKPADAVNSPNRELRKLAQASQPVIDRVNHPELRTIYPPFAQGAFALAHLLKPWSLVAWRIIIIMSDIVAVLLLVRLLHHINRHPLWVSLYWWNPIAIKELYNSAHMDAILIPLVLACLYLAVRKHYKTAALVTALATATKLWPALLLPLILRPLWPNLTKLFWPVAIFAGLSLLLATPILTSGLDQSSGFVAFAERWQTNSAAFLAFKNLVGNGLQIIGLTGADPNVLTRFLLALSVLLIAAWLTWHPVQTTEDTLRKTLLLIAAIFLLSPAQFPWYYTWVLPFLTIYPVPGILLLTATLPLYYLGFYYLARDNYEVFQSLIVWVIWVPAWTMLIMSLKPVRKILSETVNSVRQ